MDLTLYLVVVNIKDKLVDTLPGFPLRGRYIKPFDTTPDVIMRHEIRLHTHSEYINRLTSRIGLEWYMLGVELGFQTPQLEQLRYAYPHAIQQCVSMMLTEWYSIALQEIQDPSAILSEAFRNVERADISFEINKDFNVTSKVIDKNKLSQVKKRLMDVTFNRKSDNFEVFFHPTKCYIENFERDQNKYVQTRASVAATKELKTKKYLTVVGNAGDGKTTVVMHLLSKINQEGYSPIILSDPGLIEQAYDPDRKIVYFVDDAFGTPTLNKTLVETWIRLHGKLRAIIFSGNCYLVLASRKQTYLKAFNLIRDCPCYVGNVIDLTSQQFQLTPVEKKNIISCYFPDQISIFPRHRISPPLAYVPGFPLLCQLYSKKGKIHNPSEFFEKPIAFLEKQFSLLAECDQEAYCALVLVMLYDGKLPRDIFDPFEMEDKEKQNIKTIIEACGVDSSNSFTGIEKSLHSLTGVYLTENEDGFYVFSHDAIFDAICLEFGQKYPKKILEVATSEFIATRVRTDKTDGSDLSDIPEVIVLKSSHYKYLVQRWLKDIQHGKIHFVFDNPCSNHKDILKCIVEHISTLSDISFENIFQIKDHEASVTLLELICRRGLTTVVGELLQCPAFRKYLKTDILALSFIEAVRHGHIEIVRLILSLESNIHCAKLKNATHAIHIASENGDFKMLKILINAGADTSVKDLFQTQPIHLVCRSNSPTCLSLLIKCRASPSARDHSKFEPIHYACKSGSIDCLKILLENGADVNSVNMYNKTPIHYAASCGSASVLKYLLSKNPDLKAVDENGNSSLHFAVTSKNAQNIEILLHAGCDPNIKNALGKTPLHLVCSNSWREQHQGKKCIEALLDNGANANIPDEKSRTPLHLACSWSHDLGHQFVKLLIEHGADVNFADNKGIQPLECAFRNKSCKSAKLIMDSGGNANISGLYPVHCACADGSYDILSVLVEKGFSLNSRDPHGKCPIHLASQYGHYQCLLFLLDKDIDPNLKDANNQTPLHYTCKWGKSCCSDLLIKRGADISAENIYHQKPSDLIPPSSPSDILQKNIHARKKSI